MTHREAVLKIIECIGGNPAFWNETPTCQNQVNAAVQVLAGELEQHYQSYRAEMDDLRQECDRLAEGYQLGWREAAEVAVNLCEARAKPEDKNMSLRQEARKCGMLISHVCLESDPCPYCETKGTIRVNLDHPQTMLCQWCSGSGRVKKTLATNNSTES